MVIDGHILTAGVAVPERPSAAWRVGKGCIVWVFSEKMTVVFAGECMIRLCFDGTGEVDLNEVPLWAEGIRGTVRYEEKPVGGLGDGME